MKHQDQVVVSMREYITGQSSGKLHPTKKGIILSSERLAVIEEGDENSELTTSAVVYLRQWQELYAFAKYMR